MVTTLIRPVCSPTVTNGRHELVPKDVREEAEKYAKVSDTPVASTHTFTASVC